MCYKHSNNRKYYMLHGHVHNTVENDWLQHWKTELKQAVVKKTDYAHCAQIYNVGCMMPYMNYCPRTLDEILRQQSAYEEKRIPRIEELFKGFNDEYVNPIAQETEELITL